jgi:hypothetical protein
LPWLGDASKQLSIPSNAASRLKNGSCETMTLPLDGALLRGFCEVGVRLVLFNLKKSEF